MNRAELEQEREYLSTPGYYGFAEQKDYALTKLLERNRQVDAVLELHAPHRYSDLPGVPTHVCDHCMASYNGAVPYPCPTVQAIESA